MTDNGVDTSDLGMARMCSRRAWVLTYKAFLPWVLQPDENLVQACRRSITAALVAAYGEVDEQRPATNADIRMIAAAAKTMAQRGACYSDGFPSH